METKEMELLNRLMDAVESMRNTLNKLEQRGLVVIREEGEGESDEWVSPQRAAHIIGRGEARIYQLIRSGDLPARKRGGRWLVQSSKVKELFADPYS